MEAKLTLKLDKYIIEEARVYAKNRNLSLSRMVERYFKAMVEKTQSKKKGKRYSPLIEELSGFISLDADFDFKEEYTNYLMEKY
ncbi:MAG: DUF6364 family protein [Candidatus Aminicenantes bacterium]|nr:DUF6364 family protein [Candidatus Aminicenantes bacterium]